MTPKPRHWFKSIHEAREDRDIKLGGEPEEIEYLNVWTGETFIHIGGTAYYDVKEWEGLNIHSLTMNGITHYRILKVKS